MPKMILKFSASAEWVTNKACEDVASNTQAKAKARRSGRSNSGTLELTAETQGRLEAAHRYLMTHYLYSHHFTT